MTDLAPRRPPQPGGHIQITDDVRKRLVSLAQEAGAAIMAVYSSDDFGLEHKSDNSPLTRADTASHQVLSALDGMLDLPLLSEEGTVPDIDTRLAWPAHWLVDPLDGTKEFLQQNGEFTVNIALIQNHRPVFGVVHVPATNTTYWGGAGYGSFRAAETGTVTRIHVSERHHGPLRIVVSRNHMNAATQTFLDQIGDHKTIPTGSSLKILKVAEGATDAYPRLGPTMEWDTAAAHAIVEGAGGSLVSGGGPLRYNRENLLNPHFVAATPWFIDRFESVVGSA